LLCAHVLLSGRAQCKMLTCLHHLLKHLPGVFPLPACLTECLRSPLCACVFILRRRRVKSSRRQLQLQQFAEQQQQLAAERTAKWGHGLLQRLRQGLGFQRPWQSTGRSSSSGSSGTSAAAGDGSSTGSAATVQGPQQEQQQQKPGGLNLLLHGLWPAGASTTAAAAAGGPPAAGGQGLLPAPPMSQPDVTPGHPVSSHEEPKRPSGADWGVTDAALSLASLLGSSLGGLTSSSSSSGLASTAAAPGADASAKPLDSAPSKSSRKGQLSAQQQQLRNILSTVVPFDAVSLTGSNPGLTWSAQQGLGVLKEAAGRLYNELAVGSFSGGLKVEIQGRLKSLRSVHNKMERKACSVEVRAQAGGKSSGRGTSACVLRQTGCLVMGENRDAPAGVHSASRSACGRLAAAWPELHRLACSTACTLSSTACRLCAYVSFMTPNQFTANRSCMTRAPCVSWWTTAAQHSSLLCLLKLKCVCLLLSTPFCC
jgi:hypothetical protein